MILLIAIPVLVYLGAFFALVLIGLLDDVVNP